MNVKADTDVRRKRRSSKELVEEQLRSTSTISMEELSFVKHLGEGGFATVELHSYEGQNERLPTGTLVALKKMRSKILDPRPPPPGQEHAEARMIDVPEIWRLTFKSEALMLKAFNHPNVVASYGCVQASPDRQLFDSDRDDLMFLQEYCPGGTLLDKVLKPRSYTAHEALRWVTEVSRGMCYLHGQPGTRVAHRDLKLENILLSADGTAKVADFGLSRLLDPGADAEHSSEGTDAAGADAESHQTAEIGKAMARHDLTGNTGSCRYMAPEVFRNDRYSHKVDIFSFGILAYEVLARCRAYNDVFLTMDQVAKSVSADGLRPKLPKRWPDPLRDLIGRCWADKPSDRPEFEQLVDELEAMLETMEGTLRPGESNTLVQVLSPPASGCCVLQ